MHLANCKLTSCQSPTALKRPGRSKQCHSLQFAMCIASLLLLFLHNFFSRSANGEKLRSPRSRATLYGLHQKSYKKNELLKKEQRKKSGKEQTVPAKPSGKPGAFPITRDFGALPWIEKNCFPEYN